MAEARSSEDVRSRLGRFVVIATAIAVAVLMVWALYDGSDRTPGVEAAAASMAASTTAVLTAPTGAAPLGA